MSELGNYRPNSHVSKTEPEKTPEKKVEKVVTGTVKTKKKNEIHKLADVFISEDAANVKRYILMDVLVPAIKKAVSDIVTNGIDMLLYGENARGKSRTNSSYVSYNRYSERDRRDDVGSRNRAAYSHEEVTIDNRGEAEEVLARMDELIETYGMVTVADFYDLVGMTCNYTDNKYGWTNIRNAEVVRVRDGYKIKLPRAMAIN